MEGRVHLVLHSFPNMESPKIPKTESATVLPRRNDSGNKESTSAYFFAVYPSLKEISFFWAIFSNGFIFLFIKSFGFFLIFFLLFLLQAHSGGK